MYGVPKIRLLKLKQAHYFKHHFSFLCLNMIKYLHRVNDDGGCQKSLRGPPL